MAGKLSIHKERLSYAEERVKVTSLRKIAAERGVSLSSLIKQATTEWLAKNAPATPPAVNPPAANI